MRVGASGCEWVQGGTFSGIRFGTCSFQSFWTFTTPSRRLLAFQLMATYVAPAMPFATTTYAAPAFYGGAPCRLPTRCHRACLILGGKHLCIGCWWRPHVLCTLLTGYAATYAAPMFAEPALFYKNRFAYSMDRADRRPDGKFFGLPIPGGVRWPVARQPESAAEGETEGALLMGRKPYSVLRIEAGTPTCSAS